MATRKTQPQAIQLFKTRHGSVHAVVIGPEIGWRWRRVKYYRWKPSTTVPGGWDEVNNEWGRHNRSLIKCALAVQQFLDAEQQIEEAINRAWSEACTPKQRQQLLNEIERLREGLSSDTDG